MTSVSLRLLRNKSFGLRGQFDSLAHHDLSQIVAARSLNPS